ncbi:MAG: hypothetical protein ABI759_01830 [Candidatus Solibacter sp.]
MSHIIPTLRTAVHPTYTPPEMRRKSDARPVTGNQETVADFRTVLTKHTAPVAAEPAPVSRTMGSVNLGTPLPASTAPKATASTMAPTAETLFGGTPWVTDPGGVGPSGSYSYNHYYFATPATAATVAQMLGGKVVETNAITPSGPFTQNQPNQMVQMPDGRLINAGLIAGLYDHGYSQQTVDQMIATEVNGKLG